MDIFEDFTLDYTIDKSVGLVVHGDAKLTIDVAADGSEPIISSKIRLYDNASFELAGGQADKIEVYGENNRIEFTGGRFALGSIQGYSAGHTDIVFNGDTWYSGVIRFLQGGTQKIEVRDFQPTGQMNTGINFDPSDGLSFDLYSDDPAFSCTLSGTSNPGCRLGTWNNPPGQPQVTYQLFIPPTIPWTLHDSDPSRLAGDIDDSGTVDLADLNAVRNYFGSSGSSLGDTLPFDGVVDLADLNRVRNQFGQSQAVPEPSSVTLAALALAALVGIPLRRRRCSSLLPSP